MRIGRYFTRHYIREHVLNRIIPKKPRRRNNSDYAPNFEQWISDKNPSPGVVEAIKRFSKPCLAIVDIQQQKKQPLGASKFGGLPDLPDNLAWPIIEEDPEYDFDPEAFAFISQINLADLPPNQAYLDLPEDGWLYFFVDDAAQPVDCRVLYAPGSAKLRPRNFPKNHKVAGHLHESISFIDNVCGDITQTTYRQCSMRFAETFHVNVWHDDFHDLPEDVFRDIHTQDFLPDYTSKLFGDQSNWDRDARYTAYFHSIGRTGFHYIYHRGPDEIKNLDEDDIVHLKDWHARREHHEAEVQKWKPLIRIGSHFDALFLWFDAGHLEFFIHEDDLKNRDFSNVYCDCAA